MSSFFRRITAALSSSPPASAAAPRRTAPDSTTASAPPDGARCYADADVVPLSASSSAALPQCGAVAAPLVVGGVAGPPLDRSPSVLTEAAPAAAEAAPAPCIDDKKLDGCPDTPPGGFHQEAIDGQEGPVPRVELDVLFICDCTGSMCAYLRAAQQGIRDIAAGIHERLGLQPPGGTAGGVLPHIMKAFKAAAVAPATTSENNGQLRFGLIQYRDHPPMEPSFVTRVQPFVASLPRIQQAVNTMRAAGGGDGPEAVAAALAAAENMQWRPNATKIAVLIADAPPHGLGEKDDHFPNGCPDGNDPLQSLARLAGLGVQLYAVGVEPVLSTTYTYARDFMMAAAEMTGGKFLPLGKASILAEVVVAGAVEGADLDALWARLEADVDAEAAANGTEQLNGQARVEALQKRLDKARKNGDTGAKARGVEVSNPYVDESYDRGNCVAFAGATSLAAARKGVRADRNTHVAQRTREYDWASQCAAADELSIATNEQCSRLMKRKGLF